MKKRTCERIAHPKQPMELTGRYCQVVHGINGELPCMLAAMTRRQVGGAVRELCTYHAMWITMHPRLSKGATFRKETHA